MNKVKKLLLIDDDGAFRNSVRLLLESSLDIAVLAESDDEHTALHLAQLSTPYVVIINISGSKTIEIIRRTVSLSPDIKFIALSNSPDNELVMDVFDAGASAYVLKGCVQEELVKSIKAVMANQPYLCRESAWIMSGAAL